MLSGIVIQSQMVEGGEALVRLDAISWYIGREIAG